MTGAVPLRLIGIWPCSICFNSFKTLLIFRRNIRKTQASLKLVISMEKELQRVARHITDNLGQEQGDDKEPGKEVRQGQSPPFSAWAG